ASRKWHAVTVFPAATFARTAPTAWCIDPTRAADYERLIKDVCEALRAPLGESVYLWTLNAPETHALAAAQWNEAHLYSCIGPLHLVRTLTEIEPLSQPGLRIVTQTAVA